jgi:hypothetical protein
MIFLGNADNVMRAVFGVVAIGSGNVAQAADDILNNPRATGLVGDIGACQYIGEPNINSRPMVLAPLFLLLKE